MSDPLAVLWQHRMPEAVTALDWQPGGMRLAAGSLSGELTTYDSVAGDRSKVAHLEGDVLSVKWSWDGQRLAAGGRDGALVIWEQGAVRCLLNLGRWASAISWARHRPWLAVAAGPDVYVLDAGGSIRAEYLMHPGYVNDVAWEESGHLLAASIGGIRFYETDSPHRSPVAFAASSGTILKLAQSFDGALIGAGKSNGCVVVWNLEGGAGTVLSGSDGAVEQLAWSPDGRRLAVAAIDELTIWRCLNGEVVAEGRLQCPVPEGYPGGMAFHPWRDLIVWGGEAGAVTIWDPDQIAEGPVSEYTVEGDVTCLQWHPAEDRIAVGTSAGFVACLGLT